MKSMEPRGPRIRLFTPCQHFIMECAALRLDQHPNICWISTRIYAGSVPNEIQDKLCVTVLRAIIDIYFKIKDGLTFYCKNFSFKNYFKIVEDTLLIKLHLDIIY